MSLASALREIAAILQREAAALDGVSPPSPPVQPPTPPPPLPPAPPPSAPLPPSSPGLPARVIAGVPVAQVQAMVRDRLAIQVEVPVGWTGSYAFSAVPTTSDPAGGNALYSMRLLDAGGVAIVDSPGRASAASLRIYSQAGAPWWAARLALAPGTYTFELATSQPSHLWLQFQ